MKRFTAIDQWTASTPLSSSQIDITPTYFLDTSAISNLSCSEKDDTTDGDRTITNITVKFNDTKRDVEINKENVGKTDKRKYHIASKGKSDTTKKRKVTKDESDSDSEDSIVFMKNPKKSIQVNQSMSEDFLRLGSSKKEVAVGIFWDIENVRMPKGLNPAVLITKLREKFVDESSKFCEKHFYVVCDAQEESHLIMRQLFEFHVRIIHVPRLKANSSDNVIRDLMHEFVGYNKYCRLILISGDSDFSHDIHNFRRNKKCDCILVHNQMAKDSLKKSANAAYLYTDLIKKEIEEHEAKTVYHVRSQHNNTRQYQQHRQIPSRHSPRIASRVPLHYNPRYQLRALQYNNYAINHYNQFNSRFLQACRPFRW